MRQLTWAYVALALLSGAAAGCNKRLDLEADPIEGESSAVQAPAVPDGGFFNADDSAVRVVDGGLPGPDCVDVDNDEFGRPRCPEPNVPAQDAGRDAQTPAKNPPDEPDAQMDKSDEPVDEPDKPVGEPDEDGGIEQEPPTRVPVDDLCKAGGICQRLLEGDGGRLDLLFVIDNSGSMAQEQASLSAQFPRLVNALTTGDLDGDGQPDFSGVADIQLGVVSTDMGISGLTSNIPGCTAQGDDGVLVQDGNRAADPALTCATRYPRFLSFRASSSDPVQTTDDFTCIAALGTAGCGFEQPLESALKAIIPATETQVRFIDPTGPGTGHGDGLNDGFVRSDSLLAIVLLTDEDDCSASNPELFRSPSELATGEPLKDIPLNTRCAQLPSYLYPLMRYVNGYPRVRPTAPERLVFAAIVGVPVDTVSAAALAKVDFANPSARDAHYQSILDHPSMQLQYTGQTANDTLVPSCDTASGLAYPPRRIVEVAKGLGETSIVQSICQSDFTPVIDAIVTRIGRGLGSTCLPRTFTRGGGRISCDVTIELPPAGSGFAIQQCSQLGYLSPISGRAVTIGPGGGEVCRLNQVPLLPGAGGALVLQPGSGWYYDEGSPEAMAECSAFSLNQRVALTPDVTIPAGATAHLDCAP